MKFKKNLIALIKNFGVDEDYQNASQYRTPPSLHQQSPEDSKPKIPRVSWQRSWDPAV